MLKPPFSCLRLELTFVEMWGFEPQTLTLPERCKALIWHFGTWFRAWDTDRA